MAFLCSILSMKGYALIEITDKDKDKYNDSEGKTHVKIDEEVLKKLKQLASLSSTIPEQAVTGFLNKLTEYYKLLNTRCELEESMKSAETYALRQLKEDIKIIHEKLLPYTLAEQQDFALLLAAVRHPLKAVENVLEKGDCISKHIDMFSEVLADLKNNHLKACILGLAEQKGKLIHHDAVNKWGATISKMEYRPTKKD